MEVANKIEVNDIEDDVLKVKCIDSDDSMTCYLFKVCAIVDDGFRLF